MNPKPQCIVIAGPNGSGKTTLAKALLNSPLLMDLKGLVSVNPDDIAATEFQGEPYEAVILKAAEEATARREAALREGRHLLLETVFSAPDKLDFLRRSKVAGHHVRLIFIATEDPAINAARVAYRVAKGGHDVPMDRILARWPKSIANAPEGLAVADRGHVFDNSRWGEPPYQVFETTAGWVSRVGYSTANGGGCDREWAGMVLDALPRR